MHKRSPLNFALLLPFLLAAQPMGTDSYLPALPAIADSLGSASSSLTAFALAFGLGQLPMGSLADRLGRRPVLLSGLAMYAAAALAGALAGNALALTASRALQGFAMASILVCGRAAVRDLYPAADGPRVMARGLTGLGAMALISPIIGGYVGQYLGWRWVLVGMSLYALALWLACWIGFAETRRESHTRVPVGDFREILACTEFRVWTLVSAASYSGVFCFLLLSPMLYIGRLGLSPGLYAWIPAGGSLLYIMSTIGCRLLLRRQSVLHTVRQGAVMSLSGAVLQALGCWFLPTSTWPLIVGHGIYCLGHGIHQPCGQAGAASSLPHLAGRAVSWSGFTMMLAAFCMGQLAVVFVDPQYHWGAWPMVVPMLIAGAVLIATAFRWLPKLQHPTPCG
ncbi:MFS transporter [Cupriavidus sp. 2TAF22]|uniref:MFS transporter n=1 Tax=unclassified Cupriavidus TaxID=2640874 RepID=UPI003F92F591